MAEAKKIYLPVLVEKDEDGFFCGRMSTSSGVLYTRKNIRRGIKEHTRSD